MDANFITWEDVCHNCKHCKWYFSPVGSEFDRIVCRVKKQSINPYCIIFNGCAYWENKALPRE